MNNSSTLQHLALDPASLAIGFAAGAVIGGLFFALKLTKVRQETALLQSRLDSERDALGDHFRTLAQAALQSNTEQFLALAGEKLKAAQKDGEHDLQKRSLMIEQMVKPVEAHLQRMNGMVEELRATDKNIREDLQNLHKETSKLTGVLRNPSAQGKWGEFVLETILEKAHLKKGTHYETQAAIEGGGRPDVIINLHDGFKIAIDSKAPIGEHIARIDDDLSEEELKSIKSALARTVRGHVKALGARSYQENIVGCDFVILFLPSEAVFSATLQSDPTIVDYASENNVVIASPTLIISLLRVVGLSWRQVEMAKNAAEVSALGVELYKRLSKFVEHFSKVGKNVNAAMNAYNDAVGSFERQVRPQAKKFQKYHVIAQNADLPETPVFESTARQITSVSDEDDIFETDTTNDKINYG